MVRQSRAVRFDPKEHGDATGHTRKILACMPLESSESIPAFAATLATNYSARFGNVVKRAEPIDPTAEWTWVMFPVKDCRLESGKGREDVKPVTPCRLFHVLRVNHRWSFNGFPLPAGWLSRNAIRAVVLT
jgi:hypothetical protein